MAAEEYPAGWPTDEAGNRKPAHELTKEQWQAVSRPSLERAVMGNRSVNA
jgi:hypothetical protein